VSPRGADYEEEMPRLHLSRRALILIIAGIAALIAFVVLVLPEISGLQSTIRRIEEGDPFWLLMAGLFTVLSFGGYVALFQGVYVRGGCELTFSESYQITMASLAATRLLAAGGAGGIALTAWALRRAGMPRRVVADQTLAFLVLTYVVYMGGLIIGGFGLYLGIFHGPDSSALTLVPALIALIAVALSLLAALTPTDLQKRFEARARTGGRMARMLQRAAHLPAALSAGVRIALSHVRDRDPALAGSIAYWGFNVAILWASFRAFGQSPPWAVIIMGYFVGMLANLLPLPGGIGGVDGGMIGAFVAFGVSSSLALVAVLTYRVFAFWLPTVPGLLAYVHLRRTVARWAEARRREDAEAYAGGRG
jgi:uncharacterized protein (TIRG00374 family)